MLVKTKTHLKRQLRRLQTTLPRTRIENTKLYVFRKAKQESDESISAFHTRLRPLAMTCEFANTDSERI